MDLMELMRFAVEQKASDLHLQAGSVPMMRISGQARFLDAASLTGEQVRDFVVSLLPEAIKPQADTAIYSGIDFSHSIPGLSRFRCSAYSQLGQYGVVVRMVTSKVPAFKDLMLPDVVQEAALLQRGLTLVTGTTGCGKSTTLASMIDLVNHWYRAKIITIEDPVEFVHTNRKALISQLEVGTDTPSFEQALRQALRQDPDVILVGELRDVETLRMALRAADTGHQVFSTLHSQSTAQTIERIIAMFPHDEHDILLSQLATSVEAIISQRLVTTQDGKRRPAVEILRGTPVAEKFIHKKKLDELLTYIETGESGMQSFDQHLLQMYNEKSISGTEALRWATNPEALAMAFRGIRRIGSGRG
ncbi:MAG: PilT/PilU family type 4a pilus ATPase [Planctomycetia bacterium]|nr:PilT/PilU family type 4a pilus ATPase [Planctomycetia bacterium]